MTLPKPTFRDIMYMVIIAIILLFYFKSCTDKKKYQLAGAEELQKKDSIVIQQERELGKMTEARKAAATKAWEAENETQIARDRYDSTQKIVNTLTKKALRLSGDIIDLRDALPDSNWVPVHPDYVGYCDSLADAIPPLNIQINTLLKVSQEKDASFAREIKLLNEQNEIEKGYTAIANKRFDNLNANYDAYKKKVTPRNSLWLGGEAQLSSIYQTVGGQVMWQTKKGISYRGGVGVISSGGYYVSGGIAFKISLRK